MTKLTKLLTLDEAASFLGVSKVSLRRWTNDGLLACHRIGPQGRRRFDLEQLKKFAAQNDVRTADRARLGTLCIASIRSWRLNRGAMSASISVTRSSNGRCFGHHYRRRQPTLYIHSASSQSRIREWLGSDGLDFDEVTQSGLLQLFAADQSYLKAGNFSADGMVAFVRQMIIRTSSEGYPAHLITGEMDWYFSRAPGVEEIHEYERRLNFLQDEFPEVTIVCQYDVSRFDVESVVEACCTHPLIEWRGQLHRGSF